MLKKDIDVVYYEESPGCRRSNERKERRPTVFIEMRNERGGMTSRENRLRYKLDHCCL